MAISTVHLLGHWLLDRRKHKPDHGETCMQVKKQQLEPDMEQWTGSKLEKEYIKTVYCHPVYLTYAKYIMRNVGLDKVQAGIKISG